MTFKPRDYQEDGVTKTLEYIEAGGKAGLVCWPTGCHRKGQRVVMYDGTLKAVEDVKIGDRLMGPDSRPRTVLSLARGRQEMREIVPKRFGNSFVVNKDHMLSLYKTREGHVRMTDAPSIINETVSEWENASKWHKHVTKLYHSGPVEFGVDLAQTIDPYILGLLLGDGSIVKSIGFTSMDEELHDIVIAYMRSFGASYRKATRPNNKSWTNYFKDAETVKNFLTDLGLRGTSCYNKFVPDAYRRGDISVRRAVLAGLLDTDGYKVSASNFEFSTVSERLADDISFIARSLGLCVSATRRMSSYTWKGEKLWKPSFRIVITGDFRDIPMRRKCHLIESGPNQRLNRCTAFSVNVLPEEDYYGFMLDGDHLYLLDDFTVTHNSGKASFPGFVLERLFKSKPFTRAMMVTHRKTLIEQNYKTLKRIWPNAPCGIYSAGLKRKDSYDPITYAGIQSVYKKAETFGRIDLVVCDETHLISPKSETMYGKFIADLRAANPDLVLIGMTATPFRLDSGMLIDGDLFDDVIVDRTLGAEFTWFLDQGYLCEIHARDVDGRFDTSDVKKRGGDFLIQSLTEKFNRTEVSKKIVDETIRRRGNRRRGMCFAISIEHAEELAKFFNEAGVPATVAHSNLDDEVVDENIAAYMRGEYEMLVDVERYTTGFDYPGIDLIVMARPTESAALWIQCCGRGTRPVYADGFDLSTKEGRLAAIAAGPKPDGCLLLDFAGNGLRLGPMNAPITAANKAETTSDGTQVAPQKICPVCLNYVHAAQRWCNGLNADGSRCNHEFPQGEEVAMSGEIIPGVLIRRDWLREDRLFDVVRYNVKSGETLNGKPFVLVTMFLKGVADPLVVTIYMTDAAYNFSRETWNTLMPGVAYPYLRGGDTQANINACLDALDESFAPSKVLVWVNFAEGGKTRPKLLEVG